MVEILTIEEYNCTFDRGLEWHEQKITPLGPSGKSSGEQILLNTSTHPIHNSGKIKPAVRHSRVRFCTLCRKTFLPNRLGRTKNWENIAEYTIGGGLATRHRLIKQPGEIQENLAKTAVSNAKNPFLNDHYRWGQKI